MRATTAALVCVSLLAPAAAAQPPPERVEPTDEPPPAEEPPPDEKPTEPPAAAAPAAQPRPPQADVAPAAPAPAPAETSWLEVSGDVSPGFELRSRSDALPADRLAYGFIGGAGLTLEAKPSATVTATASVRLVAESAELVTAVNDVDIDGDGQPDRVSVGSESFELALQLEEVTVAWWPIELVGGSAGVMRIPFTLEQQSVETALMFPSRSPPNEVFISGSDIGALVATNLFDGRLTGSVGLFNGRSLGLTTSRVEPRGIVYSFRIDGNPFGEFPSIEGDPKQGPFRLGVGGGLLYRPATVFDVETRQPVATVDDVRTALSLRLAVAGLYVGVEYLHRLQTDSLTSRPQQDDGAYAQAQYFFRVHPAVALGPLARVGFTVIDAATEPRTVGWTDAGVSVYPWADREEPDTLKLTAQYVGERRFTEGEDAHGAAAEFQVKF